jgi:phosphate acyltransferase
VDVVVVEGFAGNIALKTAEGTARQIGTYLREAMSQSVVTRLGALLAKSGFQVLKTKMDPRRVNGGPFLGLNGIAIKSHGGTDALGFASAVDLGYEMADNRVIDRIATDIAAIAGKLDVPAGGGQS